MDKVRVRKLNDNVINALARHARAVLNLKLAERSLKVAHEELDNELLSNGYSLRLTWCGPNKIQVIKSLREISYTPGSVSVGIGLKEAKDIADAAGPQAKLAFRGLSKEMADRAVKLIEQSGGSAEVVRE